MVIFFPFVVVKVRDCDYFPVLDEVVEVVVDVGVSRVVAEAHEFGLIEGKVTLQEEVIIPVSVFHCERDASVLAEALDGLDSLH